MIIRNLVIGIFFSLSILPQAGNCQSKGMGLTKLNMTEWFEFEEATSSISGRAFQPSGGPISFVKGVEGNALRLGEAGSKAIVALDHQRQYFSADSSFTVQLWVNTGMDSKKSAVIISQKDFTSKNLSSQKNKGWVFYLSGGTWAWNLGTGDRRITHESEVSKTMPLNDKKWHQLTMTYDHEKSEMRLFYDGDQKAIYNSKDAADFDFSSEQPLRIGSPGTDAQSVARISQEIDQGAASLQHLVDEFNGLKIGELTSDEFESLIVDPEGLLLTRKSDLSESGQIRTKTWLTSEKELNLEAIQKARAALMKNPYTVHQVRDFMKVAPLLKMYSLVEGKVMVNRDVANQYIEKERLFPAEMDIDNVKIFNSALSQQEVADSYSKYFKMERSPLKKRLPSLIAGNWNIHHGGKHNTIEKDGWDSRIRIAEMLKKENADVIMLQETYSSGAFIANQLGYYYASTVDRDYLNQGTNISVLSRYPIKELYVPKQASFMNVGVKVQISQTQEVYVMSNWYGMAQFPVVYDFHLSRFLAADQIPVIFAGDFNAVPHLDGGESIASMKMIDGGFTDAFRTLYPAVETHPGYTHENNQRIDQLYFKGKGLKNTRTEIISSLPAGFPSDHYLIVSDFQLDYENK